MKEKFQNFIGVDVSKHSLDFAVLSRGAKKPIMFHCANTMDGIRKFRRDLSHARITFNQRTLVVLESCGMYDRNLLRFASNKRCAVCIENARRIKRSIGFAIGKSDVLDAKRIADYAKRFQDSLRIWKHPISPVIQLKDLLNTRERIIKAKNKLAVPLKGFRSFYDRKEWRTLNEAHKPVMAGLEESVRKIETMINELINQDQKLLRQYRLLRTVPGLGHITALTLIAATRGFDGWNARGLGKYAGIIPFTYSSGISLATKPHVSKQANLKLKSALHLAAMAAIKGKGELRTFYLRMVGKGKNKMSVLNAIRNKIVLRACAVIRDDKPYDPNYDSARESARDKFMPELMGLS